MPTRSSSSNYPGFGGLCQGKPSPKGIRENVRQSVLAAVRQTGMNADDLPDTICVFGHSLGCAAVLMAVEEFHLRLGRALCSVH